MVMLRRPRHTHNVFLTLLMFALMGRDLLGQTQRRAPMTVQTLPVSASVLATIETRNEKLELLVLWRGAPGWFLGGSESRASYAEQDGVSTANLEYGGRGLTLSFDSRLRTVRLQASAVSLGPSGNVLLVDHADREDKMAVAGVLTINSEGTSVDPRLGTLAPFFERSGELIDFLRCGSTMSNPRSSELMSRIVCDQLTRK